MIESVPKILVVDDEPRIRHLLREILSREGYEVNDAESGEEALELLRDLSYQMVISDLKMPGMDGFGLIEAIKAIQPDIAAIIITAYATVETAVQALCHGADDYVTKPFDNTELKTVVGRTLEARRLKAQNQRLVGRLQQANQELVRHRRNLAGDSGTGDSLEQINRKLEHKIDQLAALREIAEATTSLLDLQQILEACLKHLNEKLGVSSCSIMLLDEHGSHLIVRASSNAEIIGHRQRVGERIAGWVAKYKEPLLIDDIRNSGRFQPNGYNRYRTNSLLSMPLLSHGKLLGVINLTDRSDEESFSEDDLNFLVMVAGHIAIAIENARLYNDLQNRTLATLTAIADSVDARDSSMAGHSQRVAEYSVKIGQELGLDEESLEMLRIAARLHDIGMTGICDSILAKPGTLTRSEWQQMQEHTGKGDKIIKTLGFLDRVGRIIKHHHERWDGTGYPDGLRGAEIPFISRIMAIAESYDAITSGRPYRAPRSVADAIRELQQGAGSQFDPQMIETFIAMQKTAATGGTPRHAPKKSGTFQHQNVSKAEGTRR